MDVDEFEVAQQLKNKALKLRIVANRLDEEADRWAKAYFDREREELATSMTPMLPYIGDPGDETQVQ